MKLRGIDFGNVFNASGARGFGGEGYWFHTIAKKFGLTYEGSTFVSKTTTLEAREGNMPLDRFLQPKDKMPDCIVVKPFKGVVLNAVGLSGPGASGLRGAWDPRMMSAHYGEKIPFVISFMSVDSSVEDRKKELRLFVSRLGSGMKNERIALQLNFSCPNVGMDPTNLIKDVRASMREVEGLPNPIMVKLNALVPPEVACELADTRVIDAIVCSNTIPWGKLPEKIDWEGLFGSKTSPLKKYGGGGLSGAPLLPIVAEWIQTCNDLGIMKPIVGCGGVLSKKDADRLIDSGADAIELGSVSILRPWRVAGIIDHINERFRTDY